MRYILCKIKPKSSFHMGIREGSLEKSMYYIHSDTLFGGICNTYRLLYGKSDLEEMLKSFAEGDPRFLISSAFPYYDDVLLFPMPKFINFSQHTQDTKKYKKIEFISKSVLSDLSEGKFEEHLDENNIAQEKILVSQKERKKIGNARIWKEREVPRVVLDRKSSSSSIYHFGEVEYCERAGLYFLIKIRDEGIGRKIEGAIRLLGDEGLGGDRTYGKGSFEVEFGEFEWNDRGETFINLSLYLPDEKEIDMVKKGYYDIVTRGGWVYSPDTRGERKKIVRMIIEGSSFKGNEEFYGKMMNVSASSNSQKVYRYGYALPLYIGGGT